MNRQLLVAFFTPALLLACASDTSTNTPPTEQGNKDPNPPASPAPTGNQPTPPTPPTEPPPPAPEPTALYAFVGSGDGKIRTYSVDETTGAWTSILETASGVNPWFLAFDPSHHRVVAIDDGPALVTSYTFDAKAKTLTLVNAKPTGGDGPAHVAIDPSGKWVTVANYGGGNVTIRPIDDKGLLGDATDDKPSGAGSHYAAMDPLGHDLFVAAVDRNAIAQYRVDVNKGKLIDNGWGDPPPGGGPRHLVIHPSRKWCYAINEFHNSVSAYYFDPNFAGKMWPLENVSALPDDQSGEGVLGSEIVMHPNGKWLYTSHRGYNSIASFTIDPTTGKLTRTGNISTEASQPRSFGIDPQGTLLFAGNQDANYVIGYKIDPTTGALTSLGKIVDVPKPAFVGLARF